MALTGVSNLADWLQKWQSSGQPPVLAERMPSTSTSGPHHARRTSWASAASDGTDSSGSAASAASSLDGEQAPLVEQRLLVRSSAPAVPRPGSSGGCESLAGPGFVVSATGWSEVSDMPASVPRHRRRRGTSPPRPPCSCPSPRLGCVSRGPDPGRRTQNWRQVSVHGHRRVDVVRQLEHLPECVANRSQGHGPGSHPSRP